MSYDNEKQLIDYALEHGSVCIGFKNGHSIFVSAYTLLQYGLRKSKEQLGLIKTWPVRTDLSGGIVMVEGDTHEDAVERYLNRVEK